VSLASCLMPEDDLGNQCLLDTVHLVKCLIVEDWSIFHACSELCGAHLDT
jgi:hypothetical protein